MDKEVYEARLSSWRQVVQKCQDRPVGMTQKEWLKQNEISESQFYYWLRKIRTEALAENVAANDSTAAAPVVGEAAAEPVAFAEIDLTKMQSCAVPASFAPAAAVIRFGQLSVELSNHADERLISGILKAVPHGY